MNEREIDLNHINWYFEVLVPVYEQIRKRQTGTPLRIPP
jgi:hypothetical protein